MKPILDDQSAITYTSVVILVLTFFIYLVANHSQDSIVETRVDGIYKSFGWETPREQLISHTTKQIQNALALATERSPQTGDRGEFSIPLSRIFSGDQSELRADALGALQIIVDTLRASSLAVEFVVEQAPVRAAVRTAAGRVGMERAATIIRYFIDAKISPERVETSARNAVDPNSTGPNLIDQRGAVLRVRFYPLDEAVVDSSNQPTGNREGSLYVG